MSMFSVSKVDFRGIIQYENLRIERNKVTFIVGKSGSGKSTLLKLLNGSLSYQSGEIYYEDKPLEEYDTILLRRQVLLVSQSVFLFDDTVRNNFKEFYAYRNMEPPADWEILEFLRLCCGDFSLDADCRQMSGGERQRVFISICLSFSPKVLMLDEPTSALDGQTSDDVMKTIIGYCKEKDITLIAITHDRVLAQRYAEEVISLDEGEENE